MSFSKIAATASLFSYISALEPNPPAWDTNHVKIFKSGQQDAQAILDKIHSEMGGKVPDTHGHWSTSRYALLFEPGTHDVNVDVGYYTTVHGLGRKPTDVTINNVQCLNASLNFAIGALDTFWRSVENFHIPHTMTWAVS